VRVTVNWLQLPEGAESEVGEIVTVVMAPKAPLERGTTSSSSTAIETNKLVPRLVLLLVIPIHQPPIKARALPLTLM
jgi:hypothetical protein